MISLIVAMDKNGLIGKGKKLPWNIKEELKFFKEITMGKYLLMGENTYNSLPVKLVGRKIIVLSYEEKDLGFKTINDFKYIENIFKKSKNEIFIAGGKSIYEQFYKKADTIYISIIKKNYKGDVFLNLDLTDYKKNVYKKFDKFTAYKYIRIKS